MKTADSPIWPRKSNPLAGFTLTEVLVAMAIIAVIALLLIAATRTIFERAHAASCISKLRSYHTAVINYTGDHDGWLLPDIENSTGPGQFRIWHNILALEEYIPSHPDSPERTLNGLMTCPANPNGYQPNVGARGEMRYYRGQPNYLYNGWVGNRALNHEEAPMGADQRRLVSVDYPSRRALLFEAGLWREPYRCNYRLTFHADRAGHSGYIDPDSDIYIIADPHGGQSNVLFLDGHIESVPRGELDPRTIDWRYEWNETPSL